jgi:translation initiation factor 3 subunit H
MLVYDPLRTSQGSLALSALRLSDKFFALYKRGEFTKDSVTELNLSFADIYQQIPVEVSNSGVFKAMLLELGDNAAFQPTFESLDMATNSFLENNLETLNLCISDLQQEQGKQQMWQRNANKVLAQQQAFLQRRKAENAQRKAMGGDMLPETAADLEHENPALFKLPTEPSRLEALLITNQINNHCEEILKFGGQSLSKLFVSKSLISGK